MGDEALGMLTDDLYQTLLCLKYLLNNRQPPTTNVFPKNCFAAECAIRLSIVDYEVQKIQV